MNRIGAAVAFLLFSGASCGLMPGIRPMETLLPRETDVPGWVSGIPERVRRDQIARLHPLLDEYGPIELVASEYRRLSGGTEGLRVELIRFRTSLDSFGAYARERGIDSDARFYDDNGYRTDSGLYFRHGIFYGRITATGPSGGGSEQAKLFRDVVGNNIRRAFSDVSLPGYLLLVSGDRSTRNIVYRKKGIEKVPGMRSIFIVRREIEGKRRDMFFAPFPSSLDAERAFRQVLGNEGDGFILSRAGGIQPAVRIIGVNEILFMHHHKEWVFGVLNADTMNEGIVMILYLQSEMEKIAEGRGEVSPGR